MLSSLRTLDKSYRDILNFWFLFLIYSFLPLNVRRFPRKKYNEIFVDSVY